VNRFLLDICTFVQYIQFVATSAAHIAAVLAGLRRHRPAPTDAAAPARWRLEDLSGRLTELCGWMTSATLTFAFELVLDAQRLHEPVAWIGGRASSFYPLDAAESGADLDALVVVRLADPSGIGRAADLVARSGAFGLIVLDLGVDPGLPMPLQSRLLGLAQKHGTAIVCLTEKPDHAPSLGSLISLYAVAGKLRQPGRFACELRVVKDKRRAPNWSHIEVCRGSAGLR
jgi:recombination protein RecA